MTNVVTMHAALKSKSPPQADQTRSGDCDSPARCPSFLLGHEVSHNHDPTAHRRVASRHGVNNARAKRPTCPAASFCAKTQYVLKPEPLSDR